MPIEHSGATNGRIEKPDVKEEALEVAQDDDTRIVISLSWCKKGCGLCIEHCPTDVLVLEDGKSKVDSLEDCIQCQLCEHICPDFAITVDDLGKK